MEATHIDGQKAVLKPKKSLKKKETKFVNNEIKKKNKGNNLIALQRSLLIFCCILVKASTANDAIIAELPISNEKTLQNAQIYSRPALETVIIQHSRGFQTVPVQKIPLESRKIWGLPSNEELLAQIQERQENTRKLAEKAEKELADAKIFAEEQRAKGLVLVDSKWLTKEQAQKEEIAKLINSFNNAKQACGESLKRWGALLLSNKAYDEHLKIVNQRRDFKKRPFRE